MMKNKNTFIKVMIITLLILTSCANNVTQKDTTAEPVNLTTEAPVPETTVIEEEDEKHEVVLYFSDRELMATYRTRKEVLVGKEEQVEKAALEAWIKGPENEDLIGLIESNVLVLDIEEVDGIARVSFSKEIKESNLGSSGELFLIEQIAMIMQQFGFENTQILVEGKVDESLLGHVSTSEPIRANDPESYQWIEEKEQKVVLENEVFRIFEPTPNTLVKDRIVVKGLARVYEGTVLYEFEDGHFILDEGFTTASQGGPEWGEFEIIIELDELQEVTNDSGSIIIYEESAEDGSRRNELIIPVKVEK